MNVTAINHQIPLDTQTPLEGKDAAEIFNKERSQVVPVVLGKIVGWGVAGMIAIAGIVGLVAACILFPPAALPVVLIIGIYCLPAVWIGAAFSGVLLGMTTACLSDIKGICIDSNFLDAETPEKVAEVATRIGNDQDLSHLAKEMNFRQLTVLKAGIGLKRFGKVINLTQSETPALKAWKQILSFHENPNREALLEELHQSEMDRSFNFVNALRKVYPETDFMVQMDVPWYESERDEATPKRVLFTYKNESIKLPLSGPKATLYKDSLTDGVLEVIFEQNEPVKLSSAIDFNELERLSAFAMGEVESVTPQEFIYLVKAADKWSQPKLLKKLDLMHKHQPILSNEDVEELSEIPEMKNLKVEGF